MNLYTITTSIVINATPEKIWPFLCHAKLPLTAPCWFRMGVPTPERCQLLSEVGSVGAKRQCVTSRGRINQEITEWIENKKLSFEVIDDSVGLKRCFTSMKDTFLLESLSETDTRLTRITTFQPRGLAGNVKALFLGLVVKKIHRYVMKNFKTLAENKSTALS